jgi:hypothetical protein
MKTLFLLISISIISSAQGQIETYKITKSDTLEMPDLSFKRIAALHFTEATILVDYDLFMKHLTDERRGLKKQISSRERMLKRGTDHPSITSSQLKFYKDHFKPVDSVFAAAKKNKLDTFHVDYVKTPIGSFIPAAIENKQCIILDFNNQKQNSIIKLSGNKKTGQMTAVGSSFYFIPGAAKYFLSKMDWVS